MTSIASKNLYDLLGNDPELDPDREPEPPTKAVDKPVARAGKRNAGAEGPVERAPDAGRPRGGGRGGRQENFQGSEQAFRDRGAGAYQNRSKPVDDGLRQDRHPDRLRRPDEHRDIGNRGRGSRGGRGGRGGFEGRGTRTGRNDRHPNRHNESDHDKQAAHGWGGNTGDAELADEKAGEALAKEDEKNEDAGPTQPTDGEGFTPDTGAGGDAEVWGAPAENGAAAAEEKEPEPEDNSKSYEAYLAELAEKKLALGSKLEIRKPNEGSNANFPEGQAFSRDPEEADYMKGEAQKKARERQKKEKNLLEIDGDLMRPQEPRSEGGRGGRGRGRGGFRGDREGGYRGDREGGFRGRGDREGGPRGEGGFRGDGRGRGRGRGRGDGEFRGSRGGPRGGPRGGAQGANLAVDDQTAFPSLGA